MCIFSTLITQKYFKNGKLKIENWKLFPKLTTLPKLTKAPTPHLTGNKNVTREEGRPLKKVADC